MGGGWFGNDTNTDDSNISMGWGGNDTNDSNTNMTPGIDTSGYVDTGGGGGGGNFWDSWTINNISDNLVNDQLFGTSGAGITNFDEVLNDNIFNDKVFGDNATFTGADASLDDYLLNDKVMGVDDAKLTDTVDIISDSVADYALNDKLVDQEGASLNNIDQIFDDNILNDKLLGTDNASPSNIDTIVDDILVNDKLVGKNDASVTSLDQVIDDNAVKDTDTVNKLSNTDWNDVLAIDDGNTVNTVSGILDGTNSTSTKPAYVSNYVSQPYVNPMSLISQKYTQGQADNSMAPMQAYRDYRATGLLSPTASTPQSSGTAQSNNVIGQLVGGK